MSKIVHPYAHRLVTLRDWRSRWFAVGKKYKDYLKSDVLIREYLIAKLRGSYVSSVDVERGQKATKIMIKTSRRGMLIGRSGENAGKLNADILKFMKKNKLEIPKELSIEVVDVAVPETDARIVSFMVAEGLEKRLPFRRVMKQVLEKVIATKGVFGARIVLGGRLGGTEIARMEELKKGSIPLQTIRADIDFAREKAHLPYGDIGIKVWINRGIVLEAKREVKK